MAGNPRAAAQVCSGQELRGAGLPSEEGSRAPMVVPRPSASHVNPLGALAHKDGMLST